MPVSLLDKGTTRFDGLPRGLREEIAAGRAHDRFAKERYFGAGDTVTGDKPQRLEEGKPEKGFWRKLRNWWSS